MLNKSLMSSILISKDKNSFHNKRSTAKLISEQCLFLSLDQPKQEDV